jgi:archaellum component FlaC
MGLGQFLGNRVDRLGTALKLPDWKISENLARGKQTTFTGITPQSQNAGFVRNYGGNQALNINNPNPDIMRQVQKEQVRTIQQPLNKSKTPPLSSRQGGMQQDDNGSNTGSAFGGGVGSGMSMGGGKSQEEIDQERKNEEFRGQLGTQYGELKGRFGDILNTFNEKLRTLPENIKQLNQQYKTVISEKQGQELGQVGQKREQIAQQQKTGLASIVEQVGKKTREGAGRLGSLGMSSSAAGMFQKAIQNEANKSARDLLTQAANNYQELDAEENRVKSTYKTILDEVDAEEANNIKDIQSNINTIIADINEKLQRSGEFERMDKNDLNTTYINELTNRFQEAKQASESYKQQLEQWRRDNEGKIKNIKNQMVQNFIPKEIQGRELTGVRQTGEQQTGMEQGLSPRLLRRVPEDNEEIATPEGLQAITRRLRQNINQ